jgi:ferredoxin
MPADGIAKTRIRCYIMWDNIPQTIFGGRIMAYKISEDCISCGACAAECPVNAISEGDGKYEINPDVCIECGACAETCPVGAPAQA